MTVIVYGRVVGMDISLNYSQEINSELLEICLLYTSEAWQHVELTVTNRSRA